MLILFSSDRPGGYGSLDIYKSVKRPDGTWSTPENMGPTINTKEDEDYPFMDVVNNIIYFSSKGRIGMGDYDIFKSVFNGTTWTEAQNMGYPVNSPVDDISFVTIPQKNS